MFPQKIRFYCKSAICVRFGTKLCNVISHNLSFLKCFSMTKHSRCIKVTLVNFSKISPFGENEQFRTRMAQNYATFYIMIQCKDFLKRFSIAKHNRFISPKMFSFEANGQFWTNLAQIMQLKSHNRL